MSNMVVSIYHARIEYPAAVQETAKAGEAVDTTGGGHDGTLDAEDKTIPLPQTVGAPTPEPVLTGADFPRTSQGCSVQC